MGILLNIIQKIPLILIAAVIGIIGVWFRPCLFVSTGIVAVVLIWSFVEQLVLKHSVEHNDDPRFNSLTNAMMSDDWRKEMKDLAEEHTKDKFDDEK